MIDPTRHQQLTELNEVETCVSMLSMARNELYLNMRYFDLPLSQLRWEADWNRQGLATDGFTIVYGPSFLRALHSQGRILVNRAYLHMMLHCLFGHLDGALRFGEQEALANLWDLACDMAVESMIDGILKPCIRRPPSMFRRETFLRLKHDGVTVLNAERIFKKLCQWSFSEKQLNRLAQEFFVDGHDLWRQPLPNHTRMRRQNQWKENRERMQTELETTGSMDSSDEDKGLLTELQVENRERYDYRDFLRKFSVLREEIQVDPDSFDPIFYSYGLEHYGNMPLVEPLETKELYRVEEFVIVIDTSMSCSGELVRQFLEETYTVLAEGESYFKTVKIHVIQCDEKVQEDTLITSKEELKAYMERFAVVGQGGTDFRPAFEYVNGLIAKGSLGRLRGLLYFTDGKGIYPVRKPNYDTAFIFMKDHYEDVSVPGWAMKLVLEPEDVEGNARPKDVPELQ